MKNYCFECICNCFVPVFMKVRMLHHLIFTCSDEVDNQYNNDDDFEFKDTNDDFGEKKEEFTSYERTKTTHTEKITTKRRMETKKIDLGAAANQLQKTSDSQVGVVIFHYTIHYDVDCFQVYIQPVQGI